MLAATLPWLTRHVYQEPIRHSGSSTENLTNAAPYGLPFAITNPCPFTTEKVVFIEKRR
jgi:hypothetical protein